MVLTGAFGGALANLVLASQLVNQVWLAIATAFVAVVIALIVRRLLFRSYVQLYFPLELDLLHVIIASLIGGLAGHELAIDLRDPPVSPLIGATSGLIASALIACFLVTVSYRRNRG
jgi:membrane protease YdiL (CAAX protease family)